ncbi:MAG: hypothetical protein Q4G51_17080 [Dermatophilus congolensis]|nr:hypothetical protein [Dermatophilus congolensis]
MSIVRPTPLSHRGDEIPNRAGYRERLADAEYALAIQASPFLGDRDIVAALHHMTQAWENETGVPTRFQIEGTRTRTPADAVLLRVAHAALQNVALHSCAERTIVVLSYLPGHVHLSVLDDGRGFDLAFTKPGPGLRDLSERIHFFGGTLSIESVPGHGCLLEARIPLPRNGPSLHEEWEAHTGRR